MVKLSVISSDYHKIPQSPSYRLTKQK